MKAYENNVTIAHQSDMYIVGMTRLINPVKTLA